MTIRFLLGGLLLASLHPLPVFADDQVRSVQEELRRRKLYFGNVDGRETSEVDEAVKRYQKRKGLNPAGARDPETLRSLGLAGRGDAPPTELSWPQERVLRSDLTINVVEAAEEIAEETGVTPASIVGEKLEGADSDASAAQRKGRSNAEANRISARGEAPRTRGGGDAKRNPTITPKDLRKFVRDFLEAAEDNTLRNELRFYGEKLAYFNNGVIDRRIVERDLIRYHERWPHRRYRVFEPVAYSFNPARAEIVVTYQVGFTLKGHGKTVKGSTQNRMVINAGTSDPRIVSIQEQRRR